MFIQRRQSTFVLECTNAPPISFGRGGCSVVRYPTAGALSLASAARMEIVFVKEGLEWRRGGVQSAWTEW